MSTQCNKNHIRQLFRVFTATLCLFGIYGLYQIIIAQYYAILRLGFSFNIQLSGLIGFITLAIWVYVFAYITIYRKLPGKRNSERQ